MDKERERAIIKAGKNQCIDSGRVAGCIHNGLNDIAHNMRGGDVKNNCKMHVMHAIGCIIQSPNGL